MATLVAPTEEVDAHRAKGRTVLDRGDVKGIANVRQWIVDQADEDVVIMLDDDLGFFKRRIPTAYNLRPADTFEDQLEIFEALYNTIAVEGYVHAGISPRQMNNQHFPAEFKEVMRMNAVHAVSKSKLQELGLRYTDDGVQIQEEYHLTLRLLKKGYPNKVWTKFAWDQQGVSGAPGGCSLFRTSQVQADGASLLESLHPDVVKVINKSPKNAGAEMANRLDVRIQWKKAYQSSM